MYMILLVVLAIAAAAAFAIRAHRDGRLDAGALLRRASTILGLLTLAQGGAILAYNQAPASIQQQLPDAVAGYLLVGMMLCGALTPVATSIRQTWFMPRGES